MNFYQDDTFVEELVVRRNSLVNVLIMFGMVIVGSVIAMAAFVFLTGLFPAILAIVVAGIYIGIKFQGVEYEYSFTNGDLDIDKIMAKRKRKTLAAVNHKQIQVMAPYTAEYEELTKDYQVSQVIDASAHKNAAGRWFAIYEDKDGKYVFLVFQPSKRLREAMRKYMRSRIKGMDA